MLIEKIGDIEPLLGLPALLDGSDFPVVFDAAAIGFQQIRAEINDRGVFRGREGKNKWERKLGFLFYLRAEKFEDAINCFCLDLDMDFGPLVFARSYMYLYRGRTFDEVALWSGL